MNHSSHFCFCLSSFVLLFFSPACLVHSSNFRIFLKFWMLNLKECVRRRVMKSVIANPYCSEAAAKDAMEAVWDVCYNDTKPFDRAPWINAMTKRLAAAKDLASQHLWNLPMFSKNIQFFQTFPHFFSFRSTKGIFLFMNNITLMSVPMIDIRLRGQR